jgi:hypothetical protein
MSLADGGMSLVELTVTCLMLAMVLLLVTSMSISLMGTNHGTMVRGRETDEARVGMAELAKNLDRITAPSAMDDANRSTAIVDAKPDRIVFWTARDAGTDTAAGVVTVERCEDSSMVRAVSDAPPEPDYSPCDEESPAVIARHVATGVFRYHARGSGGTNLTDPNSALGDIGSVEVRLAIGDSRMAGPRRPAPSTVIRRFHLTQWKEF